MFRIPFAEIRFFDPTETRAKLERRFEDYLRGLRWFADNEVGVYDRLSFKGASPSGEVKLSRDELQRIQKRVARLLERRNAASGMGHLKPEDRDRLNVLRDGVQLLTLSSEHRADEIAAQLHAEAPWMGPATQIVW